MIVLRKKIYCFPEGSKVVDTGIGFYIKSDCGSIFLNPTFFKQHEITPECLFAVKVD